jgi:hypothetical protein
MSYHSGKSHGHVVRHFPCLDITKMFSDEDNKDIDVDRGRTISYAQPLDIRAASMSAETAFPASS